MTLTFLGATLDGLSDGKDTRCVECLENCVTQPLFPFDFREGLEDSRLANAASRGRASALRSMHVWPAHALHTRSVVIPERDYSVIRMDRSDLVSAKEKICDAKNVLAQQFDGEVTRDDLEK